MNKFRNITLSKIVIYTLLTLWAFTTIYPFYWIIINSVKESNEILSNSFGFPKTIVWDNYINAFQNNDIAKSYYNSLIISGTTTVVVLFLSSMASFAMVRYEFKGKKILYMLFLGSLMIPAFSTIIPIFTLVAKLGLINKYSAVIVPQIVGNLSFAIIVLMGFMATLPLELEESAFLEGSSVFGIYRRIIVPLSIPSLASVAIFTFLWSYNDLFLQMIMLRKDNVLPISALLKKISSQFGTDFGLMAASVTLVIVPVLIIYIILQKFIIKSMTQGALKG